MKGAALITVNGTAQDLIIDGDKASSSKIPLNNMSPTP
jgi:hypothetical protein